MDGTFKGLLGFGPHTCPFIPDASRVPRIPRVRQSRRNCSIHVSATLSSVASRCSIVTCLPCFVSRHRVFSYCRKFPNALHCGIHMRFQPSVSWRHPVFQPLSVVLVPQPIMRSHADWAVTRLGRQHPRGTLIYNMQPYLLPEDIVETVVLLWHLNRQCEATLAAW